MAEASGGEDEEEGAEELLARERWFLKQRAFPNGRIPQRALVRAHAQANALRGASLQRHREGDSQISGAAVQDLIFSELGPHPIGTSNLSWTWGGPVPYAGRVSAIANHPTNAQVAYVGGATGGVWKTENGGSTWTPVFDQQASLSVGSIAIDPSNPNVVYVGTGEANFGSSYFGAGLYRSTNGGASWQKLAGTRFDACVFAGLAVRPGTPNTIVAAVHGYDKYGTSCRNDGRRGIHRSTDGGTTWSLVRGGTPTDLAVAPNNPAVWYAGAWGEGVLKSVDGGLTWARLGGTVLPTADLGRVEITVAASPTLGSSQTVYTAFGRASNSDLLGIWGSSNGGSTWSARLASDPRFCHSGATNARGQCNYDLALAADPANPTRFYAAGILLYRYLGGSYTQLGWTGIHVDFHVLGFDALGRLWLGSDGGVYRTSDGGSSFQNLNHDLAMVQGYPGLSGRFSGPLLSGSQDNGSFRYNGVSRSWTFVNWGDGGYAVVNAANPNLVYATSQFLSITKIVNGVRCNFLESGGLLTEAKPFIAPLVASPANANVMFAGTNRVYRAANASSTACGATSWVPISQGFGSDVNAIAGGTNEPGAVYAGTINGGLWVTRGSTTWVNTRANGLNGATVTDIYVDPANAAIAYATVSGFGAGQHVYRTTNYGASWQSISGNLPNSPTNAIVLDKRTSPATIYVGTDVGLFWSGDGGTTWENTSVGLPNTVVMDLLLDTAANRLIASTFGRGVWAAQPISSTPSGPPNDSFAAAKQITTLTHTEPVIATGQATDEAGEPLTAPCPTTSVPYGKTVWFRYTPAGNMTLTADTLTSTFDTVLVVYRGTTLAGLTRVACNDDVEGQTSAPSKVTFAATAGQTYYFQVAGWRDGTGTAASGNLVFKLASEGPANDSFAAATTITSLPHAQAGLATGQATDEAGEPLTAPCPTTSVPYGKTVWFRYTPAANMTLTADTVGSSFDTVLVVRRGTTLGGLTLVGCDDDGGGGGTGGPSRVTFAATAGQTYYFQVGGWRDGAGTAASGNLSFRLAVG
jgi:photosystem II stability/assembly factor-like uncharacterized protein